MLNHGITHNALGADSLGSGIGDFVEEYVFPGGELAHVSRVIEGLAAQGLELDRRRGAARALREDAVALGRRGWSSGRPTGAREVGEERYRVWRIYMAGSAHAFDRGWLSLWQLLAGKPHARRPTAASADARLHVQRRLRRPAGLQRGDAARILTVAVPRTSRRQESPP